MTFLQLAGAVAPHPLDGSASEWIWLVLLLPLLGACVNALISAVDEWVPGPYDPDAQHWGRGATGAHGEHLTDVTDEMRTLVDEARDAGHVADSEELDLPDLPGAEDAEALAKSRRHRWFLPVSVVGIGVMLASFGLSLAILVAMWAQPTAAPFVREYFSWMEAGEIRLGATLWLDQLSIVMTLVITGVGTLIHLFSVGYMARDAAYPRYFLYLNLFVFFMLLLVLGGSYPLLFVGWEGVGFCSYLLIGFWFNERKNADAGRKAFIINRIGDLGFLIAMFLMFAHWRVLDFGGVQAAVAAATPGASVLTVVALMLFVGCAGKSAQIPLFTWLPDAMAGPTPVSALIHAATMVTAGVYLILRSSFLFAAAPAAALTVVVIGASTALFAATIGLRQWDIKKVLAYSTVSQLGFMFAAVGAGAYVAGLFHVVTHAFFKALLFLGAGSVIHAMHHAYDATGRHEDAQDMRNMGGLAGFLPITAATMWVGTLAIAGIPPLAGFFSKDEILAGVFARAHGTSLAEASWLGIPGHVVLYTAWGMLSIAAVLTAVYMTRMMWFTFHGANRTGPGERGELHESGWTMALPLIGLAVLAAAGGWLNLPKIITEMLPIGPTATLEHWLDPVVGAAARTIGLGTLPHLDHTTELVLLVFATGIAVTAVVTALWWYRRATIVAAREDTTRWTGLNRLLAHKYFVDEIYHAVFVRPLLWFSQAILYRGIDRGLIDRVGVEGVAWRLPWLAGRVGSALQNGRVSTYAWVLVLGAIAVLVVMRGGAR
jgi:NADH-quinone oxidoreductase subunit L